MFHVESFFRTVLSNTIISCFNFLCSNLVSFFYPCCSGNNLAAYNVQCAKYYHTYVFIYFFKQIWKPGRHALPLTTQVEMRNWVTENLVSSDWHELIYLDKIIIKYAACWEARTHPLSKGWAKPGEGCPVASWEEHGLWRQAVMSSDLSSAPFSFIVLFMGVMCCCLCRQWGVKEMVAASLNKSLEHELDSLMRINPLDDKEMLGGTNTMKKIKQGQGRERAGRRLSRKEDFWGKQENWVQIPSTYLKKSGHGYIGLEPQCWSSPVCSSAWHVYLLLRLLVQRLFFQNHRCLGTVCHDTCGLSDTERCRQRQKSLRETRNAINRWKQEKWLLKTKSVSVRRLAVPDGWDSEPLRVSVVLWAVLIDSLRRRAIDS